jgi:hypothetical protein
MSTSFLEECRNLGYGYSFSHPGLAFTSGKEASIDEESTPEEASPALEYAPSSAPRLLLPSRVRRAEMPDWKRYGHDKSQLL